MYLESAPVGSDGSHAAGRQLLEEMYCRYYGTPVPPVLTAPGGKPYFQDSPVFFSVSHTKTRVFCAMGEKPLGVDAEDKNRPVNLKLAEKILSPGEMTVYQKAPDKALALLSFWVLKEAAVKLTGEGLRGFPNRTDFTLPNPHLQEMDGHLVAVFEGE